MARTLEQKPLNTAENTEIQITGQISSRVLFWTSRYMVDSEFLYHLPFTFWLADVIKPSLVVEVGVTDGQSYFGLCQAVDRLDLPARCYGIQISDQTQTNMCDAQDARVKTYNAENYGDFSKVIKRTSSAALKQFTDRAIDILVINAALPTEVLEQCFETAHHKLSTRGVVLLSGFPSVTVDTAAHNVTQAFVKKYSSIIFEDGTGIAVVMVGENQDERLTQLASLKVDSPAYNNARLVFSRLGLGHYNAWLRKTLTAQNQIQTQRIRDLTAQLEATKTETKEDGSAHTAQYETIATAQAKNLDQYQAPSTKKDTGPKTTREKTILIPQHTNRKKTHAEKPPLTATFEGAPHSGNNHATEIAALIKQLETAQTQIALMKAKDLQSSNNHTTEIVALTKQLETLEAENAAQHADFVAQMAERDECIQDRNRRIQELEETLLQADSARIAQDNVLKSLTQKAHYDDQYRQVQIKLRSLQAAKIEECGSRLSSRSTRAQRKRAQEIAKAVKRHPLFQESWYLDNYPDVRKAAIDPALHYVLSGVYEGRDPGPQFNTVGFYVRNPDLLGQEIAPLLTVDDTGNRVDP